MEGTKEGVGGVTTAVGEGGETTVGETTVVIGGEDILRASGFGGTGGFGVVDTTGEWLTGGVEEVVVTARAG
ncbi:MAG: hypothetical protein WA324_01355 [Bryobacteraceae bacterium]